MPIRGPLGLTIGDLEKRTGVRIPTIRYYEMVGLLAAAERTAGNQRRYCERAVDTLRLIRHARDLGFDTAHIRDLLALAKHPERPCAKAATIARHNLEQVERRMMMLRSLRSELKRMIEQCSGGRVANCRVLEVLTDFQVRKRPSEAGRRLLQKTPER